MPEIVVSRWSRLWQDRGRNYRIFVDGKEVGTVANNADARIAVTPGRHTVRLKIDWCWSPAVEVDVPAGTEYRLECGPNSRLFLGLLYITFRRNEYIWLRDCGATAVPMSA